MKSLTFPGVGACLAFLCAAFFPDGGAALGPVVPIRPAQDDARAATREPRCLVRPSDIDSPEAARWSTTHALAVILDEPIFDRERWERAAAALAAELAPRQVVVLASPQSVLGDEASTLAAAALVRHAGGRSLPPSALIALRTAWLAPVDDPRSAAAARSLAALGTSSDRAALVADLAGDDPRRRALALWALEASRPAPLVRELVARLAWAESRCAPPLCAALRSALERTRSRGLEIDRATLDLARDRIESLATELAPRELAARSRAVLAELDAMLPPVI